MLIGGHGNCHDYTHSLGQSGGWTDLWSDMPILSFLSSSQLLGKLRSFLEKIQMHFHRILRGKQDRLNRGTRVSLLGLFHPFRGPTYPNEPLTIWIFMRKECPKTDVLRFELKYFYQGLGNLTHKLKKIPIQNSELFKKKFVSTKGRPLVFASFCSH